MKNSHTPGPWGICDYELGLKAIAAPAVDKWLLVATDIEAKDAALIAAAPELLAAAQKALAFLESLPYEPSIHPSTKAQDALHDAIAKATGETP